MIGSICLIMLTTHLKVLQNGLGIRNSTRLFTTHLEQLLILGVCHPHRLARRYQLGWILIVKMLLQLIIGFIVFWILLVCIFVSFFFDVLAHFPKLVFEFNNVKSQQVDLLRVFKKLLVLGRLVHIKLAQVVLPGLIDALLEKDHLLGVQVVFQLQLQLQLRIKCIDQGFYIILHGF